MPCYASLSPGENLRSLQVGEVVLDLGGTQLPEARALCAFHAFVAQEVVGWGTNDA